MAYLADCDPLTGRPIRSGPRTACRYEKDRPGELVHMDVKKIGKIPDGGGWKAHGRAVTTAVKDQRRRIGYDYVHSLVDEHSRLAYSEILPDETGPTCAAFLLRAAYFASHGVARIERVTTDNAWAYRRSQAVQHAMSQLGAHHKFIKPHCPGRTARLSGLTAPCRSGPTGRSSSATPIAPPPFAPWLELYKNQRRHIALGGLPPASRLSPTW
jgi:hypothetical protein